MSKVHFKKEDGRWYSFYYKGSRHAPITWGYTMKECRDKLLSYKPQLLEV